MNLKNKFGLTEQELNLILATIAAYSEIEKAYIFGSRAKGNYKTGSDVDIAIAGESITLDTVSSLYYKLNEECPLIYFFDIVDYNTIKDKEVKKHIDRIGVEIFHTQEDVTST
ncbi:MAG: nucleotidyltransferase domain-containing protein [Spirochaetota bacterium]